MKSAVVAGAARVLNRHRHAVDEKCAIRIRRVAGRGILEQLDRLGKRIHGALVASLLQDAVGLDAQQARGGAVDGAPEGKYQDQEDEHHREGVAPLRVGLPSSHHVGLIPIRVYVDAKARYAMVNCTINWLELSGLIPAEKAVT